MNVRNPDNADAPVVGLSELFQAGTTAAHQHLRTQLIFASRGSLTVLTERGLWVLPPSRALFVPGRIEHALRLRRPAEFRTIYFDTNRDWTPRIDAPVVIDVTPLVRELILAIVDLPWNYPALSAEERLARVLCDQLGYLNQQSVHLPYPQDPRAQRLAQYFVANPAERRPLAELARAAGASLRTLERRFKQETNHSLGQWVQQFRLLFALERLAEGVPVNEVAYEVGFDNPSSFIALFRARFGTTPARFFV